MNRSEIDQIFNQITNYYDQMNDYMSLGCHISWKKFAFNKMLFIPSNANIVDLACGSGDMTEIYLTSYKKYAQIFMLDPSESMLELCQNKFKKYHNINLLCCYAENIPLKSNSIDCVIMSFGLRNTDNKLRCLREIYRIMKYNSQALIVDFHQPKGNMKSIFDIYKNYLPIIGKKMFNDANSYEYLISSIEKNESIEYWQDMILECNFTLNTTILFNGLIAVYHLGKKI